MLPGVLVESDVPLEGDVVYETEEREEEVLTCIKENINSTLTQAKIIKEKIDDFKDDYTQDKFQTSWTEFDNIIPRDRDGDILEVCSVEQTCSTVLPSLPAISVSPPTTDTEVVRMLDERFGEIPPLPLRLRADGDRASVEGRYIRQADVRRLHQP
ncbi:uncharacterized protein LOC135114731 [Scylla paramamosain]|uniref:uncharacterized protein LOC135114731 n=1 Tax=Scylla paramamosain TaxID=85552 RepID=UPI003082DA6C